MLRQSSRNCSASTPPEAGPSSPHRVERPPAGPCSRMPTADGQAAEGEPFDQCRRSHSRGSAHLPSADRRMIPYLGRLSRSAIPLDCPSGRAKPNRDSAAVGRRTSERRIVSGREFDLRPLCLLNASRHALPSRPSDDVGKHARTGRAFASGDVRAVSGRC